MKSGRQSDVEYKRFGVQGKTSKEINKLICQSIYHQWGNFYQCGQTIIAQFNENSSGSECQSSSVIQRTSGRTEERRSKANRNRRSWRMGGRKNFK